MSLPRVLETEHLLKSRRTPNRYLKLRLTSSIAEGLLGPGPDRRKNFDLRQLTLHPSQVKAPKW